MIYLDYQKIILTIFIIINYIIFIVEFALSSFFAKFYIFKSVLEQSMYFLAIVGLLSTVIAAFYYLRIIKIIYFDKEKKYYFDHSLWLKFSLSFLQY